MKEGRQGQVGRDGVRRWEGGLLLKELWVVESHVSFCIDLCWLIVMILVRAPWSNHQSDGEQPNVIGLAGANRQSSPR